MRAELLQLCPALCDPVDCSPSGSSVPTYTSPSLPSPSRQDPDLGMLFPAVFTRGSDVSINNVRYPSYLSAGLYVLNKQCHPACILCPMEQGDSPLPAHITVCLSVGR